MTVDSKLERVDALEEVVASHDNYIDIMCPMFEEHINTTRHIHHEVLVGGASSNIRRYNTPLIVTMSTIACPVRTGQQKMVFMASRKWYSKIEVSSTA